MSNNFSGIKGKHCSRVTKRNARSPKLDVVLSFYAYSKLMHWRSVSRTFIYTKTAPTTITKSDIFEIMLLHCWVVLQLLLIVNTDYSFCKLKQYKNNAELICPPAQKERAIRNWPKWMGFFDVVNLLDNIFHSVKS